jgi:hypothetical protein
MISPKEIVLSPSLSIWKSTFDITNKDKILIECEDLIKRMSKVSTDGYAYYIDNRLDYKNYIDFEIKNELDKLMVEGLNACIQLFKSPFNEIKIDVWVNVVRFKDPVQKNYKKDGSLVFHNHVDLNIANKLPPPFYTFVCYIQMPNNLKGDDGVLFMEDVNHKVYSILPEDGDIIIMKGDLPHVPNYAPNSNKDRIVLAGSVRMDLSKQTKSLI